MLNDFTIPATDPDLSERVWTEIGIKTKPPGSLGRIEALAHQIALAQNTVHPAVDPAQLLLFAADHGLVAEGVSAWPQEVTGQMVLNFLAGGAAANVFAGACGAEITVVDAGLAHPLEADPKLLQAGIRAGTRNSAREDALTLAEVRAALQFGADLAVQTVDKGACAIVLGEMGIGNTASAALVAHAIEGLDLSALTGPGAGLDQRGVSHKLGVLERCIERRAGRLSSLDALAAFGGLEIACMAGAVIGAASRRAVVLVDGFIATAAVLAVLRARPEARDYVIFAHRSKEPGHALILDALGVTPLLDLDMRLGEGSGALLALPLLRSATAMLNEMATFEGAGVAGKSE